MKTKLLILLFLVLALSVTLVACHEPEEVCNHKWTVGELTTEPTCLTDGVRQRTCLVCDTTKAFVEAATGAHQWSDGEQTKAPGCGTDGEMTYTCAACNTKRTAVIPATEKHTLPQAQTLKAEPTCGTPGAYARVCTTCGYEATTVIPPTSEHVAQTSVWIDNGDKHYNPCESCGRVMNAQSHTWDEGTVVEEVQKCKDGIKRSTCTGCGKTDDIVIKATTPHKSTASIDKQAGTLTTSCRVCSQSFVYTIDKLFDMEDGKAFSLMNGKGTVQSATSELVVTIREERGNHYQTVTREDVTLATYVQAQNNDDLPGNNGGLPDAVLTMDLRLVSSSNGTATFNMQFFNSAGATWGKDRGLPFLKSNGNALTTDAGGKLCDLSATEWTTLRIEFFMTEDAFTVRYYVNDTYITQRVINNTLCNDTYTAIYYCMTVKEQNTGYYIDNICFAHK